MAVFLFFCVVILSLIPSGIIRVWIFTSAFGKLSNKHKKKIKNERTVWQRINLWYLVEYKKINVSGIKKQIIAYWVYWAIVIIVATMFAISALGIISHLVPGFAFYPLMLFDIVIWIIWVQKGKKTL